MKQLTGQRFGRLLVVREHLAEGRRRWMCLCDCGTYRSILQQCLTRDKYPTRSCGCKKADWLSTLPATIVHGHCSMGISPTYRSWTAMMTRCYYEKHPAYYRYGGRGITVCPAWHDFTFFLIDMGKRPDGLCLDREDNDKGYDLGNCRWVTSKQQARNRRNNHILTHNGMALCLSEWVEITGLKYTTIKERIKRGWTDKEALTIPVGGRRL